jgi:hypothetical protein
LRFYAASVAAFVFGVTAIELMLVKNQITDVNNIATTGQLIPVVLGAGSILKMIGQSVSEDFVVPRLIWGFMVSY